MGELAPLTRPVSPRQTVDIDVCPNTAVMGSAQTEIEFEEEPSEAVTVPRLRDPGEPTQQELDDHVKTHVPFRGWCPHCVRGRAKNAPHPIVSRDADAIPVISLIIAIWATEKCQKSKMASMMTTAPHRLS